MKEINLYVCGGFIKAWHNEAITLSKVTGYKVIKPRWAYGYVLQCGFPNYVYKKNFEKLIANGYKIIFWHGKIKEHHKIGEFEKLEDLQNIKYDQFIFIVNKDDELNNINFDMA